MNDIPRQKLKELIQRFGTSLSEDRLRCLGMLMDVCGDCKKEIAGIMAALDEKIPEQILKPDFTVVITRKLLVKKLEDNRAIAHEVAEWAVDTWGIALMVMTELGVNQPSQPVSTSILSAEDYFNRAYAKRQSGDNQGAIADYDQALRLKPDYAEAYINRGTAKSALGDKQGAIADYDQALRLKPDHANPYYNCGNAKSDLGDKKGAIADYNQAIRLKPDYAEAYYNCGNAKSDLGDKQGAIADYNQAIRLKPDLANAYYNRGLIKKERGEKQEALADLRKAAELYQQQGNTEWYNNSRDRIRELGG